MLAKGQHFYLIFDLQLNLFCLPSIYYDVTTTVAMCLITTDVIIVISVKRYKAMENTVRKQVA